MLLKIKLILIAVILMSIPFTSHAQNGLSMDDVMKKAIQSPSSGSKPTGITVNKSRQQMQRNNYGNANCAWSGGHDMLGIPGAEVRVYCKCNGQIAADTQCAGPKPTGNYYNNR